MIVCRSHGKKSQRHEFLTRDNADWYMNTPQKALYIEYFFSVIVSENLDIYGIMQGVSIFSLSRFLFMLMQITVRHRNIRRTSQKVQRER